MATRILFLVVSLAAAVLTYYAGQMQGIEDGWRHLGAAIAVGVTLGVCLLLFLGPASKARAR